jgi:putative transposase
VLDGLQVARKRILRLMRENGLLPPHRHLPRSEAAHDGRITTDAPNLMWGTDATQIPTVLDGKVWLFAVVEHWNAEGLGWHVAKIGDRYAAAQAVGVATVFGAVAAGIARGVALRSAFMADHFQNQIKFWGMPRASPSSPSRNQRRARTLLPNLQGTGRLWPYLPDHRRCPRAAVSEFFQRYNAQWLIAKNGLRSPRQTHSLGGKSV